MRFVEVSIPRSPLKPLTYSVPEGFPEIRAGMRVIVPLGPRFVTAFVTHAEAAVDEKLEIKQIADLLDPVNLFSPVMLQLTQWMSEYYLAEWADILKTALPPALDVKPGTIVSITEAGVEQSGSHPILRVLEEQKNLPLKEIYTLFGHRGIFSQLRELQDKGAVEMIPENRSRRRPYNTVELNRDSQPPTGKNDLALYEYLRAQNSAVSVETLRNQFKGLAAMLRRMSGRGQVRCFWMPQASIEIWPELQTVSELHPDQESALHRIQDRLDSFTVFLLHGVTGSGKTEIYLRTARQILSAGKSVLVLVPEIALLPFIFRRAQKMLRENIGILHSELSDRERLEEWQKVRRGEIRVVIGTRSAVFAPLKNLGLIVIDEEHDGSYKQGEYPRYHARETAIMRAQFEKCPILLGSATPSIESFYNAGSGKYQYLSLPQRVTKMEMPQTRLVDMKTEYQQTGNAIFSRSLLETISVTLERKQQVLILQNRRGYAAWLMCRACGNILECPHCSVMLTYHKVPHRMVCHYCDYQRIPPSRCEKCKSSYLHLFGVGTQKIAESLRHLFPHARIERFDRDATRKPGSIPKTLSRFARKEIDILVGTQMIAKGHDFPDITLVGIVGADSAIGVPDFRASERLFQLITQVSGRSGRGSERGQVILQTFHPNHYAIQCSLEQSYQGFYDKEIRFRRLMQFPPFVALANVIFSGKDSKQSLMEAREFAKLVLAFKAESMKIVGPAIAPIARIAGQYRFQILVKSPSRTALRECLNEARKHFEEQQGHSRFTIDIDPYSLA